MKAEAIRATDEPSVAVLDVDQAELALNPTRTRVWAATGVPWEVETPGNNRKQVMFGAVNSRSGQTHFQLSAHKRSADFQQYVDRQIVPAYPQADFIFLIVDGASIYKSKRPWPGSRNGHGLCWYPCPVMRPSSTCRSRSGAGYGPWSRTTITSVPWMRRSLPPNASLPSWSSNLKPCYG